MLRLFRISSLQHARPLPTAVAKSGYLRFILATNTPNFKMQNSYFSLQQNTTLGEPIWCDMMIHWYAVLGQGYWHIFPSRGCIKALPFQASCCLKDSMSLPILFSHHSYSTTSLRRLEDGLTLKILLEVCSCAKKIWAALTLSNLCSSLVRTWQWGLSHIYCYKCLKTKNNCNFSQHFNSFFKVTLEQLSKAFIYTGSFTESTFQLRQKY